MLEIVLFISLIVNALLFTRLRWIGRALKNGPAVMDSLGKDIELMGKMINVGKGTLEMLQKHHYGMPTNVLATAAISQIELLEKESELNA